MYYIDKSGKLHFAKLPKNVKNNGRYEGIISITILEL